VGDATLAAPGLFVVCHERMTRIPTERRQAPTVRTEGRLVHGVRQVATAEGRLVGPDGNLYAHASTTCLVFDQA